MDPEEVEFPSTLRFTVEPSPAVEAMAHDAVERSEPDESDEAEQVAIRSFADVSDLRRLLTTRRVELIRAIIADRPSSISDVADQVGRNYSDVHDDVELLEEYGVVYFRKRGGSKQPIVPYDRIEIDATIAEAAPA